MLRFFQILLSWLYAWHLVNPCLQVSIDSPITRYCRSQVWEVICCRTAVSPTVMSTVAVSVYGLWNVFYAMEIASLFFASIIQPSWALLLSKIAISSVQSVSKTKVSSPELVITAQPHVSVQLPCSTNLHSVQHRVFAVFRSHIENMRIVHITVKYGGVNIPQPLGETSRADNINSKLARLSRCSFMKSTIK